VACTALLTFYRVCARRGSLLANVIGIAVHDHWKPYYTMPGVLHALCNAHHLRELKALVEIEKEEWARRMQRLLRRACHATNLTRERSVPLKPALIACSNAITTPLWPAGWPSMRPKCRWPKPPSKAAANGEAASRAEPGTTFCCASRSANRILCASCAIRLFPLPTIRPNAMGA